MLGKQMGQENKLLTFNYFKDLANQVCKTPNNLN